MLNQCAAYWCSVYELSCNGVTAALYFGKKKYSSSKTKHTDTMYVCMCVKITTIMEMIKFYFFCVNCWLQRRRKRARDHHNHIQTTDKSTRSEVQCLWQDLYQNAPIHTRYTIVKVKTGLIQVQCTNTHTHTRTPLRHFQCYRHTTTIIQSH